MKLVLAMTWCLPLSMLTRLSPLLYLSSCRTRYACGHKTGAGASVAVAPTASCVKPISWIACHRTFNSTTPRYILRFHSTFKK